MKQIASLGKVMPLVLLLFVSACGRSATATPATQVSQIGTTAASSGISPEIPSSTTSPEPTTIPPTETSAPAAGLNSKGPYVLFEGDSGMWIANPDGGFLTRIFDQGIRAAGQDLRASISPQGDRIAVVVTGANGPDLVVIDLPSGKTIPIAHLQDITQKEIGLNSFTPKVFAFYAITRYPDLAWEPGAGGLLAFSAVLSGKTADLYSYDFGAGRIRQLVTDPTQTIDPVWSPDGKYLLQVGISWVPPYGATYVGYHPMDGVWAVRLSDGAVVPQPAPKGDYTNLIGWQDASHYVIFDRDDKCVARNLRSVDVTTGGETPIADFCFYSEPALSPDNGAVIFSIDSSCSCSFEEGTYLLLPESPAPKKLTDKKTYSLNWLPESGLFQAYPEALFSADGSARYDPPTPGFSYQPAVSSNGNQAWEVIENRIHRVKVKSPDGDWQAILEGDVGAMVWDPGAGDTLLIALEDGTLYAASAPDFVPHEMGFLSGVIHRVAWTT